MSASRNLKSLYSADDDKGRAEESYPMFQTKDENNRKETNASSTQDSEDGDDHKGIVDLLSAYAEICSLNGIIFIKSSKYMVAKTIWTILLLAATGVMLFHLYMLGTKYFSYPKQTKLDLGFASLKFPAVTLCNVNAIKRSDVAKASKPLQDLVNKIDPTKLMEEMGDWTPEYEHVELYNHNRTKREAKGDSKITQKKFRKNNYMDSLNFTDYDDTYMDDYSNSMFNGSWEAESQAAAYDQIVDQFINLYSKEKSEIRQEMGHQIQDMLLQCSFAGRMCAQKEFTLIPTSKFGNCYTIQYDKFIAKQSGPNEGLSLILYLEPNEYIPGIANGKGAQLVIHEPKTIPFPDDEGVVIGAGMDTTIGLRKVSISRLGKPHGDCTEPKYFQSRYGLKYTRQACQDICKMENIRDECGCYDRTKPRVLLYLNKRTKIVPCQSTKSLVMCMQKQQFNFTSMVCHCASPCKEIGYRETISAKPWPTPLFATLMAKTICKEDPNSVICEAEKMDDTSLRENFAKVTIFYESLDYQTITEEEDYTLFQFVSDIGGTVGLYIGLSVLSMFEVFHLFISIGYYLIGRNEKKRR